MQRLRLAVSLCVVSVAAAGLLVGCGSGSGTPRPDQGVRAALGDFCDTASLPLNRSLAVPGAGAVTPQSRNHLVALSYARNEIPWADLPDDWRPATIADTEFVACVSDNVPVVFETCTYVPSGKVTRARFQTSFTVYEAATGREIRVEGRPAIVIQGTDPPPCPEKNPSDTSLEGERIAWATIQPHLESLLAGEAVGLGQLTLTGGPNAGSYSLPEPLCSFGQSNPGVWKLDAFDKAAKGGVGNFFFLGYDGTGFADLGPLNLDAKLALDITIGRPREGHDYKVVVARTAEATIGEGTFSVDVKGATTTFTFTGKDASGVGIAWTVFCASVAR